MTQHEAAMRLERAWVDLRLVLDAAPIDKAERRALLRSLSTAMLVLNDAATRLRASVPPPPR